MSDNTQAPHFSPPSSNPYLPNTAQIPNILFDYWMQHLSPAEFKVLMAIARKTYGWQKKRDRISLSQLTALTGLHKSAVIRSSETLIEYGLVTKLKFKDEFDGSNAPNQYEINLDALEKEGVVASCDTPLVASCDTQNPISTKPNNICISASARVGCGNVRNPIQRANHVSSTEEEHAGLIKDFGEEVTQKAYVHLSEWKEDTPRSKWKKNDSRSIRRWVIGVLEDNKKKKVNHNPEEEHKALAIKIILKFPNREDIILGPDYLEFRNGPTQCEHMKFKDKDFLTRAKRQLENRRLDIQGVF